MKTVNLSCPLQFWKNIVFITTTKTAGNIRVDQDAAIRTLSGMRQRNNESLPDYQQRFLNAKETYILLDIPLPSESIMATTFIQGLDTSKYSDFLTYLHNELSNGRDLFPTDLASAIAKASKWLISSPKGPREASQHSAYGVLTKTKSIKRDPGPKGKNGKSNDLKSPEDPNTCAYCHKSGHTILKCFKLIKDQAAAKSDGHLETKKATAAPSIARQEDIEEDITGFTSFPTIGNTKGKFVAFPVSDSTKAALAFGGSDTLGGHQLLVDTGANMSIIMNPLMLRGIKQCKPVTFDGLHGNLEVRQTGSLLGICKAYYHPEAVANILSFSQLKDLGHNIMYNQESDEFILRFNQGVCSFTRRQNGLYVCDVLPEPHSTVMINTVASNESNYTTREIKQAKAARDLQRRLGNPTDSSLCKALSQGYIISKNVVPSDITRAHTIYGPNTEGLKGRTTKKKGTPIPHTVSRRVSEDQTMYADIFFACGNAFLITLIQPLGHTITTFIEKTDIKNLRSTIRQHLGRYGQKQIRITSLHSDNEKGITAMALDFSGLGISLLQVGAGMHVPQIERRIRYIKELSRSVVNGLPYTCPRKIFQYLVIFVTSRANMFPSATAPHGDSPFRLMEGRTPTDKDTNMEFGALYQVSSRTMDNSMDSRTIAAIGIAQVPNGTGTCRFMTLRKPYAVITANHFVHVPMNQDVIDLLNEMASQDSRPISKDIIFRYHGSDLEGPSHSDDIKGSETSPKRNHPTYNVKPVDTNIKMPIMLEGEEANHPDVHTSPELPLIL